MRPSPRHVTKSLQRKSLLSHIQYIRDLLDTKVLEALVWIDTRDMVADGLTKGSVDRDALHKCMAGIWLLQHSAQAYYLPERMNLHSVAIAVLTRTDNFTRASSLARAMAESDGTWVKLGFDEWKYLPPQVRDFAQCHGMTWREASELASSSQRSQTPRSA